jgi:hypothetical protein
MDAQPRWRTSIGQCGGARDRRKMTRRGDGAAPGRLGKRCGVSGDGSHPREAGRHYGRKPNVR